MVQRLFFRLLGLLLLISISGVCLGESEIKANFFVQGGASTITYEDNNIYILTVQNVIPYFQYISDGLNTLASIQELAAQKPKIAVINFDGLNNVSDKLSMTSGDVIGISFSDDYSVMNLTMQPPQYYIRGGLEPSRSEEIGLDKVHPENNTVTRITLTS